MARYWSQAYPKVRDAQRFWVVVQFQGNNLSSGFGMGEVEGMPKRSSKSKDLNQMAASIVAQVTAEPKPEKNPAAVALGRLGGLKGGKARANKLSAEQRKAIAKKAAHKRWRQND